MQSSDSFQRWWDKLSMISERLAELIGIAEIKINVPIDNYTATIIAERMDRTTHGDLLLNATLYLKNSYDKYDQTSIMNIYRLADDIYFLLRSYDYSIEPIVFDYTSADDSIVTIVQFRENYL